MSAHQVINAHLQAAERNSLKRAQHLIAATQHAEANDIPHFGRWSESAVHARAAIHEQRELERRIKNGTAKQGQTFATVAPDAAAAGEHGTSAVVRAASPGATSGTPGA